MTSFEQILSIDYDEFMKYKIIPHSNGNYPEALKLLIDTVGATATTYNALITVEVPVDKLMTNDTMYYYDYELITEMDIIDDIEITLVNSKSFSVNYHIGNVQYEPTVLKEYISTCAKYSKFIIRITLTEKPTECFTICISRREYVLNNDDRRTFHKSMLHTKTNSYYNGCCMPLIESKK